MDLFKLVGSIFIDTEEANKSLAKTDEKAGGVGNTLLNGVKTAGKFALGLGTAAAAGATALMGVATKASETADEIDKMSQKMGISREGYQEWSYVMGQNGMDISTLNTGMKTLVNQMEGAANGSSTASKYFEQLGVSIYDANGNLKDQESMLNEVIYALADVEDSTLKSALATDLFGKAGTEMLPMLNSGADGIADLTQRSHDLGLVMSDDAVAAGVLFGDTLDDVKKSFGMVVTTIGTEVMPIIQNLMEWVLANMPTIQAVVGDVFHFIQEVVKTAIDIIQELMPTIEVIVNFVMRLWENTLKPLLAVVIDFINNVFAGNIKGAFQNLIDAIKIIWGALVEILKKPINAIIAMINKFVGGIVDGVNSIIDAINSIKVEVPSWLEKLTGMSEIGFNLAHVSAKEIPLLAEGGDVAVRGSAIVGERGPELLDLPVGARVTPLTNNKGELLGSAETVRILKLILDELKMLRSELYDTIIDALTNGVEIDWSDRELARLIRKYAG